MTVLECIRKNGLQTEVDEFKRFQSVDIDFINSDGKTDETQFDVHGVGTKSGNKKLAELFSDFCIENGFSKNTVISVTVVASADTMDELL